MFKGIHISIGSRIIKTSVSAALAVLTAESLNLDFSALAVTAAIMTLQPTLHETLDMAQRRLMGAAIGSFIAIPFVYLFDINSSIEVFIGVLTILALSNALSLTTSSVLGVFAFVSIVTLPGASYITMFDRFINTVIGVMTSIIINALFPVQSIADKSEDIMNRALKNEFILLMETLRCMAFPEREVQSDLRALTNEIIKELGDAYNTGNLLKSEQRFSGTSDGYKLFDKKYHALWIIHNSVLQIQIDREWLSKCEYSLSKPAVALSERLADFLEGILAAEIFAVPKGTKKNINDFILAFEQTLAAEIEAESYTALGDEISFYAVFLSNLKRFSEYIEGFEIK